MLIGETIVFIEKATMKKIFLICLIVMLNACFASSHYGSYGYDVSVSGAYTPNYYYGQPYYGTRYYGQPYYGNRYYGQPYYGNRYNRQPYYNNYYGHRYNGWNNRGNWGGQGYRPHGGWQHYRR